MNFLTKILPVVCAIVFSPSKARAAETTKNADSPPTVLVTLSGGESRVEKESLHKVSSDNALSELWAKHLGTSKDDPYGMALVVDFKQCEVVAIFLGKQVNVRRIRLVDVSTFESSTVIRFVKEYYQTAGEDEKEKTPFIFVVLSRKSENIVLEEGVQAYKGRPIEWKRYTPQ